MHFLALNWGYFLAAAFAFYLMAMMLQLRNMKRISRFDLNSGSFIGSFGPVLLFGMAGSFVGLLFVIGLVANFAGR